MYVCVCVCMCCVCVCLCVCACVCARRLLLFHVPDCDRLPAITTKFLGLDYSLVGLDYSLEIELFRLFDQQLGTAY